MNELEIIRSQLAVEQAHAAEVANACVAAFGSTGSAPGPSEATAVFREACVSYLVWVLSRFEERDQTLSERLAARPSPTDRPAAVHPLAALIARSGTSREALARLEAALAAGESPAAPGGWREFARFFNSAWMPRRTALEGALAAHLGVADWRAVYAIDADSVLDERNRFGRIAAHLPAGIDLRRTPPADTGS